MSEKQILMTVSDFSGFFLGIISWKGGSLLNGGVCFSVGVASFLSVGEMGDHLFWWGGFKKITSWGGAPHAPLHYGKPRGVRKETGGMNWFNEFMVKKFMWNGIDCSVYVFFSFTGLWKWKSIGNPATVWRSNKIIYKN